MVEIILKDGKKLVYNKKDVNWLLVAIGKKNGQIVAVNNISKGN